MGVAGVLTRNSPAKETKMTVTATEAATWKVEHSWEATTLDYLSPIWYETQAGFTSEVEAEVFMAERQAAAQERGEMIAYRISRVPSRVEREAAEDAEAAFQRQFWADRARVAREAEEARREIFALRGKVVKVVKGRKIPKGTQGEVFWVGEDRYGNGYRVGFKSAEGEVFWTSYSNVEEVTF